MAVAPGKTLDQLLIEAGNRLLQPPFSDYELIRLLDQLETFLSRVDQSPSVFMRSALSPSVNALVVKDLLRHSNEEIKVAVASCISEITRITAPNAPYDDDVMKEFFEIIVSSFAKLSNEPSISYTKRASILETFAKVRLCVVMLDLECDSLIIEMFRNFFKSIRHNHPEIIFASMAAIMSLVLEEIEDISVDLLTPLLDSVKLDNQACEPGARSLGAFVLKKCASKIKPYLDQALKSLGTSLDDYNEVVSFICLNDHSSDINTDATASVRDQPLVEFAKEASDIATADGSSQEQLKHKGVTPVTSDGSSPRKLKSPKKNNNLSKDFNNQNKKQISDDMDCQNPLDPQPSKVRVRKYKEEENLNSPVKSHSSELPESRAKKSKKTHNYSSEDPLDVSSFPLGVADDNTIISRSLKRNESEEIHVASSSPRELIDDSYPIKGNTKMKKERSARRLNTTVNTPEKASGEGTVILESRTQVIPGIVSTSEDTSEARTPVLTNKSIIETKLHESKGKGNASFEPDHKSEGAASQRSRGKRGSKKSFTRNNELKTPKNRTTPNAKQYGANLLNSRIEVWWPDDKRYYKGVIDSYFRLQKRHRVVYDDGDTEILNLVEEKWKFLGDEKKNSERDRPVESPEMKEVGEKGNVEDAPTPVMSKDVEDSNREKGYCSDEPVKSEGGEEGSGEDGVGAEIVTESHGGSTPEAKTPLKKDNGNVNEETEEKNVSRSGNGKSSTRRKQKPAPNTC